MKKIFINNLKFIGLVLGVVASFMIFFPSLGIEGSQTTFTGLEVTLGHEFANIGSWVSGQIKFSFFSLFAYLLPVVGAILLFNKKNHIFAAIAFGAATVMLFLVPQFSVVTVDILGNINEVDVDWTYSTGLIVAGILSSVALLISLYAIYEKQ